MTNPPSNPFVASLADALDASRRHREAVDHVEALVGNLSDGLENVTRGLINAAAVPPKDLRSSLGALMSTIVLAKPRHQLGDDAEDRVLRLVVVAVPTNSPQRTSHFRLLWEVEFGPSGYPLKLEGPRPGDVTVCTTDDECTEAFLAAASSGLVGRKVEGLIQELKLQSGGDQTKRLGVSEGGSPDQEKE